MDEKLYILIGLYLDKENPDEVGKMFRNVNTYGVFKTKQECEHAIEKNWFYLFEHWNNACVIEEWDWGYTERSCFKVNQFWYKSEDPCNELPKLLLQAPEEVKFNKGKQTYNFGFS